MHNLNRLIFLAKFLGVLHLVSCDVNNCVKLLQTICLSTADTTLQNDVNGCQTLQLIESTMRTCAATVVPLCQSEQDTQDAQNIIDGIPGYIETLHRRYCLPPTTPVDPCMEEQTVAEQCLQGLAHHTHSTSLIIESTTHPGLQDEVQGDSTVTSRNLEANNSSFATTPTQNGPTTQLLTTTTAGQVYLLTTDIFHNRSSFCSFAGDLSVSHVVDCTYNYMTTCAKVSSEQLASTPSAGYFSTELSKMAATNLSSVMEGLCSENCSQFTQLDTCVQSFMNETKLMAISGEVHSDDVVLNATTCRSILELSTCLSQSSSRCPLHAALLGALRSQHLALTQFAATCSTQLTTAQVLTDEDGSGGVTPDPWDGISGAGTWSPSLILYLCAALVTLFAMDVTRL